MYGYIYVTTNIVNGKKYIGKHKSEEFDKSYIGSGVALQNAINKYGKENFTCELIESFDTREQLNDAEIKYINTYDAVRSADFYNIAPGGDGGDTYSGLSEEQKHSFCKKIQNRWNDKDYKTLVSKKISDSTKGKIKSDIHIQHMKESFSKNGSHVGEKNSMYGVDRSGEKAPNFGRHYYNNGTEEYLLYEDVYESDYKDKGFKRGRLQCRIDALHKNLPTRLIGNTYTKGKIRIHKDNQEKLIYPEQLESYVLEGWIKGRKKRS